MPSPQRDVQSVGLPAQENPASTVHVAEQPSPATMFASSHVSPRSLMSNPSPHAALIAAFAEEAVLVLLFKEEPVPRRVEGRTMVERFTVLSFFFTTRLELTDDFDTAEDAERRSSAPKLSPSIDSSTRTFPRVKPVENVTAKVRNIANEDRAIV